MSSPNLQEELAAAERKVADLKLAIKEKEQERKTIPARLLETIQTGARNIRIALEDAGWKNIASAFLQRRNAYDLSGQGLFLSNPGEQQWEIKTDIGNCQILVPKLKEK